ncbi:DNA-directed RNA polymerase I subunit RPA1-like [Tubulanus polymorphus]|uniref:DNA-directed RNA polymerase I subunit RPA1-like n=1 Tax=Tubulanus polymorphus TaxID=672921 RepID=UPI003DA26199
MDRNISHVITGVSFNTYCAEDIKRLSVKEITNPNTFDSLGQSNYNGLHDSALGPLEFDDVCSTCGLNSMYCPGHMGHITLPLPIYNPIFFQKVYQIMKGTCFYCHRLLVRNAQTYMYKAKLKILEFGCISRLQDVDDEFNTLVNELGSTKSKDDVFSDKMDSCVSKIIKEESEKCKSHAVNVRNVLSKKQEITSAFIDYHLTRCSGKCHFCQLPVRGLRSENNCKIYFSKKLSRAHALKIMEKKKKQQKSNDLDEELIMIHEEKDEQQDSLPSEAEFEAISDHTYITPTEARDHLREVWKNDGEMLKLLYGSLNNKSENTDCPIDIFFVEVLPVPPNRFRPVTIMGDKKFESGQTANYAKVIESAVVAKTILMELKRQSAAGKEVEQVIDEATNRVLIGVAGNSITEKLQTAWVNLQNYVNLVMDSDLDRLTAGKDKLPGIKQVLEKKEGLFRKNMMGKRVDYAARSVISPDPNIHIDEIGIPEVFAKKLTYPTLVTPWNVQDLRQAVINGPSVHPGASFVENEYGKKIHLNNTTQIQREAIANQLLKPDSSNRKMVFGQKKVFRHLRNGDILLLNRQPTLHRPSMQAHKARVLPGEKTLRLHYACCKAYNADFDGDEMNAHFPQNEIARAEAYEIAAVPHQFLVPKDGTPLAGLIQDHVVSGSLLSLRGRHFNRADYQQLVYSGLSHRCETIKLLPPCIQKPVRLWSGKQVISTLIINLIPANKPPITLHGTSKVSGKNWHDGKGACWRAGGTPLKGDDMLESQVIIRDGELLCGLLDKAHYGPTPYGLVHCCYEIYGPEMAGSLLTCFARLFTIFLQLHGFTLGVEDILVRKNADEVRTDNMVSAAQCGPKVAAKALGVEYVMDLDAIRDKYNAAHFANDDLEMKELDLCMKTSTDEYQNQITKACMPAGLIKQFPYNNLQLMVQSGAKGSSVNCMQISCLLGQIELEGRRPPIMISGRSLPAFLPYDTSPRAGGFIDGRFLTGIRPQEYFFHCMAGREGLVDTAVKTSRSGYLQRCIVKHLEGLKVNYDLTVRESDGSVVQFAYGEDSLDIPAVKFSSRKQFPFLMENYGSIVDPVIQEKISNRMNCTSAQKYESKLKKWKRKNTGQKNRLTSSPFLLYESTCNMDKAAVDKQKDLLVKSWRNCSGKEKEKFLKQASKCPDPVVCRCSPNRYFGSISERMSEIIDRYLEKNASQFSDDDVECPKGKLSEKQFRNMMYVQNQKALAQPGHPVGLLAAQSIGEPSTQMTLNTFHFAGRGEMNVTLGIPRLREILMIASNNLKTPAMDIPLIPSDNAETNAKYLQRKFTRIQLSEVLESVDVCEFLTVKKNESRGRNYRIKFNFLPYDLYSDKFDLTPDKILDFMEKQFIVKISHGLKKKMSENAKIKSTTTAYIVDNKNKGEENQNVAQSDEEAFSDDDLNDGDATAAKQRERVSDELEYIGEDAEKQDVGISDNDPSDEELPDVEGNEYEAEIESNDGEIHAHVGKKTPSKGAARSKKKMDSARIHHVLHISNLITDYKYDHHKGEWCEISYKLPMENSKIDATTYLENEAKKTVVYETQDIKQCFLSKSTKPGEEGLIRLKTDGVNIQEMYKYSDILQIDKLYSNHIHEIARTYGIEAAGQVIVKEVRDVFAAYGIEVDYRHLSLIADYMTFSGVYLPFNRTGINSNSSPFQKMSFETTMNFLKTATMAGSADTLESPSSRIVVGLPVGVGTGCFKIHEPTISTSPEQ